MKTTISKTIIPMLVVASALAGSALADPVNLTLAGSPEEIVTLGPTASIPDTSTPEIQIPVQFARFGACPHPGAAFAPFDTIHYVPSEEHIAFQNPGHPH